MRCFYKLQVTFLQGCLMQILLVEDNAKQLEPPCAAFFKAKQVVRRMSTLAIAPDSAALDAERVLTLSSTSTSATSLQKVGDV
jgi:hypothetical protein